MPVQREGPHVREEAFDVAVAGEGQVGEGRPEAEILLSVPVERKEGDVTYLHAAAVVLDLDPVQRGVAFEHSAGGAEVDVQVHGYSRYAFAGVYPELVEV